MIARLITSTSEREESAIKSFLFKGEGIETTLLATAKCSLNRLPHQSSEFQGKVVEDDFIYKRYFVIGSHTTGVGNVAMRDYSFGQLVTKRFFRFCI